MSSPTARANLNVIFGTMYFNYKGYGWSEKYPLLANAAASGAYNFSQVLSYFQDGVSRRAKLLGLGVNIVWARLTNSLTPHRSIAAISGPQAPILVDSESTVGVINDIRDGYHFRLENASGFYGNRILRGLRDTWISDQDVQATTITTPPLDVTSGTYVGSASQAGLARKDALADFLQWIGQNSGIASKVPGSSINYNVTTIATIAFRAVAGRKTGRPFGIHRGRAQSQS